MTATTTFAKLLAYRPGRLAANSFYSLVALSLRTGAQVVVLVLLARALGASGFGAYTTTVAVATLLAPFACMGVLTPLVRDVAQNPNAYAARLATALLAWLCAAPLISLIATAVAIFLPLPISWSTIGAIVAAEVLFAPLVDLAGRSCQAHDSIGAMSSIMSGLILMRLMVLLVLLGLDSLTVDTYAWGQLYIGILYSGAVLAFVIHRYGVPAWREASFTLALQDGRVFIALGIAQRMQTEINKPILLACTGAQAAGIFAAAHRAIDAAMLPVSAFVAAATPNLHRTEGTRRAVLGLLPAPLVGVAGLGAAIWFGAPLLPLLLGPTYAASVGPAQMLCVLPLFSLLRALSITALIAGANRAQLMMISLIIVGISTLSTLSLVTLFGLSGAVYSLYLVEATVLLSSFCALRK